MNDLSLNRLGGIDLFEGLTPEELSEIEASCQFHPHKTGDVNEFEREKNPPVASVGSRRAESGKFGGICPPHPHEAAEQRSSALRSFIPSLPVALT